MVVDWWLLWWWPGFRSLAVVGLWDRDILFGLGEKEGQITQALVN